MTGPDETALLADGANVEALAEMSGVWVDRVRDRRPLKLNICDMASSVSI